MRAALPSISNYITQRMSCTLLVKGAAIEASASLSEMPTAAALRAPQSLAPSPHIPQLIYRLFYKLSTRRALSSGLILAYTLAFDKIELNMNGF